MVLWVCYTGHKRPLLPGLLLSTDSRKISLPCVHFFLYLSWALILTSIFQFYWILTVRVEMEKMQLPWDNWTIRLFKYNWECKGRLEGSLVDATNQNYHFVLNLNQYLFILKYPMLQKLLLCEWSLRLFLRLKA